MLQQVMGEQKARPLPFSIKLNETTDVAQCSDLLFFCVIYEQWLNQANIYFLKTSCSMKNVMVVFNHIQDILCCTL
jgi:hypothetical protein